MAQHIMLGDVLESIAAVPVAKLGFKQSMEFLQAVKKPVELEFRHARHAIPIERGQSEPARIGRASGTTTSISDLDDSMASRHDGARLSSVDLDHEIGNGEECNDDTVLDWTHGPLGLTLKRGAAGQVVVSRLTGRGLTHGLTEIASGDILTGVNDIRTKDVGFDHTMHLLKTLPKPVALSFEFVQKNE